MREWKKVVGYEEYYEVSSDGIIRRISHDKTDYANNKKYSLPFVIKQRADKDGYLKCTLFKNGCAFSTFVHRVVAMAFIENPEHKAQVNHKNGIKSDNNLDNLEWATASENIRHRIDVLGVSLRNRRGSKKVCQYDMQKNLVSTYVSAKEAMRQTGLSQGHISECCRGEIKHYKRFIWEYENIS